MWTMEECYNYLFISMKNGPTFCTLENFPTNLHSIYETYYVVFTQNGHLPALFPYAQRRYHDQSRKEDSSLRGIYCPWKDLLCGLKELKNMGNEGKTDFDIQPSRILSSSE